MDKGAGYSNGQLGGGATPPPASLPSARAAARTGEHRPRRSTGASRSREQLLLQVGSSTDLGERSRRVTVTFDCKVVTEPRAVAARPGHDRHEAARPVRPCTYAVATELSP